MKKKLTAIILTILMLTTTAGIFTACKDDNNPSTGLTAEQQVAEIKRINDGAYNAYFNKVTQNPQRTATYSEEDDRTEWFETWFKVVSGVVAAIIEEKQTDVLTESYTFLDAANIASGITAVFTERGIEENFITQISNELVPMCFTIQGVRDNTIYISAVEESSGFVMNASITYEDDDNYSLNFAYPRGGEFIDYGKYIEHFDSVTREWYQVYYETVLWPGHSELDWHDYSSNPATTYEEAKAKVDQYILDFDNAVATFPEKETVLLIFAE